MKRFLFILSFPIALTTLLFMASCGKENKYDDNVSKPESAVDEDPGEPSECFCNVRINDSVVLLSKMGPISFFQEISSCVRYSDYRDIPGFNEAFLVNDSIDFLSFFNDSIHNIPYIDYKKHSVLIIFCVCANNSLASFDVKYENNNNTPTLKLMYGTSYYDGGDMFGFACLRVPKIKDGTPVKTIVKCVNDGSQNDE